LSAIYKDEYTGARIGLYIFLNFSIIFSKPNTKLKLKAKQNRNTSRHFASPNSNWALWYKYFLQLNCLSLSEWQTRWAEILRLLGEGKTCRRICNYSKGWIDSRL